MNSSYSIKIKQTLTKPAIFYGIYCTWCINLHPINNIGRIRLPVSTLKLTYEFSGTTHVTPFRSYKKHWTGPSAYGPWVRTNSNCSPVSPILWFVELYRAQLNEIYPFDFSPSGQKVLSVVWKMCNTVQGCHVGHFCEFVDTACCTYGQSNTTIEQS